MYEPALILLVTKLKSSTTKIVAASRAMIAETTEISDQGVWTGLSYLFFEAPPEWLVGPDITSLVN